MSVGMERYLRRLEATSKVRSSDHYNVPQRKESKKVIPSIMPTPPPSDSIESKGSTFRNPAVPRPSAQSKSKEMPTDFWKALHFFLDNTALSAKEVAAIEAQFRQAHMQKISTLSLDDIEDLLVARAGDVASMPTL
mmetsp:Transcript_30314/g.61746  ORF Transcript_30314/g.61746 Transcript_30314/m.61746 type:complete len:136 (+) Transcript_30314:54-461(+)